MVTYACYHDSEAARGKDPRVEALFARARSLKLQKPHLIGMTDGEGVLPVTVAALKILRRGGSVSIIADLRDVRVPTNLHGKEGITDLEWRESWLSFLESHLIPFHHADPAAVVDPTTVERTSAIRSYRNGIAALEAAVAAHQRPIKSPLTYVCGRPPYGYKVVEQALKVDLDQAAAVTIIFKAIRKGKNIREAIDVLMATGPTTLKREFWDRTKVARILAHAPLYCTGAYKVRGSVVSLPHLVFLPAKWLTTGQRVPVSPAGVPDTMAGRS